MRGLLLWIQLLSVVLWVGGLLFFAFILAPVAFSVLPSTHLAGAVVGTSLRRLDVLGLICGVFFILASAFLFLTAPFRVRGRYEMQLLLALVMILGTAYIHFNIIPSMDRDTASTGGDIALVPASNPARIHFNELHLRSERVEGLVLLLGLGIVFLLSREGVSVSSPSA